MLYAIDETLNSTSETNNILYVNLLNLNKIKFKSTQSNCTQNKSPVPQRKQTRERAKSLLPIKGQLVIIEALQIRQSLPQLLNSAVVE